MVYSEERICSSQRIECSFSGGGGGGGNVFYEKAVGADFFLCEEEQILPLEKRTKFFPFRRAIK